MKTMERKAAPKKQAVKTPKRRRVHPVLAVLFCIGIIAMSGALWLGAVVKPPPENPVINGPDGQSAAENRRPQESNPAPRAVKKNFYTFVLAGLDPEGYNTDVLMVAAYDAGRNEVHIVNIPRDTQITGDNGKIRKINASWTLGAEEQLKKDLQKIIGFAPSNTMLVNVKGFVRLVDAVDGVEFDVPQNMTWRDPIPERQINLKKGPQTLNGSQALQLVRFRDYRGVVPDFRRIEVTQQFLKAAAQKVLSLGSLFKIPEFIGIANDNIKTGLTATEMLWFAQQMMKLKEDNIHFYTLAGDPTAYYKGQNYVILDQDKVLQTVNQAINPFSTDITADHLQLSVLFDEKK